MPETVLVVGAGGIGSLLLIGLAQVLPAGSVVDVVDLDTIETTNLGRQATFTRKDRGALKSVVACRAAAAIAEAAGKVGALLALDMDLPLSIYSCE
jgi:molybdopterin/thiamine biosynthesis adenylyltransferase